MRIVAVDPGGVTGLAYCDSRRPAHIETTQLSTQEAVYQYLEMTKPTVIVCERFDDRLKPKKTTSHEIIGTCQLWAELHGFDVFFQNPSDVKKFWDNDKLKALGLYQKGKHQHANDAIRHLLRYVTFYCRINHWMERLDDELRTSR